MKRPLPIQIDLHMHTSHSHGTGTTQEMFEAAAAAGLSVIGFSEHSPRPVGYSYATDYQYTLKATFPRYIEEVAMMKARAAQRGLTVLLGLEVDYIPGQERFATSLCDAHPYDYVIGGLHFQETWGFDGPPEEWDGLPQERRFEIYTQYYTDLAAMCRTGLFSIAAHPDLIKIYSVEDFHAWLRLPEAQESVATALQAMRDNGVAMEISSAGLRKPCREIYPGPFLMERAADFGLAVTFGSDAHCVNTPAYAFDELSRYASRFGFTASMTFSGKQPQTMPFFRADSL